MASMNLYETSDLGLASSLCCLGFRVDQLKRDNPRRVLFCFLGDQNNLERSAQQYWDGSLHLPAIQLFTHQKLLKQRIYGDHQ